MTGVHAGQPLSSEISNFRVPTLSIDPCIANDRGRSPVPRRNPLDPRIDYAKINNHGEGHARHGVTGKSCRDAAESKTPSMRGNSRRENREILLVSLPQRGDVAAVGNGQKTFTTVKLT